MGVCSMAQKVSDLLIERLLKWNIHRVYGYTGNPVMSPLSGHQDGMQFIQIHLKEG